LDDGAAAASEFSTSIIHPMHVGNRPMALREYPLFCGKIVFQCPFHFYIGARKIPFLKDASGA
jgi:hypothetical protein